MLAYPYDFFGELCGVITDYRRFEPSEIVVETTLECVDRVRYSLVENLLEGTCAGLCHANFYIRLHDGPTVRGDFLMSSISFDGRDVFVARKYVDAYMILLSKTLANAQGAMLARSGPGEIHVRDETFFGETFFRAQLEASVPADWFQRPLDLRRLPVLITEGSALSERLQARMVRGIRRAVGRFRRAQAVGVEPLVSSPVVRYACLGRDDALVRYKPFWEES